MFTVTKNATAQMQTGLSNNGFTNVDIDYQPVPITCGNGQVDAGETCDGAGCPISCAPSGDPCMDNVLVGSASTCDAACTLQSNGMCDGDGGDPTVSGGCATGRDGGLALVLLMLGLQLRRRVK
jgi:hypothetical protein